MLANSKIKIVEDLVADLTKEEIIWLNGYLAGIVSTDLKNGKTPAIPSVSKITIAYGTETGNAKKLATSFATKAKKQGIQSKLVALDQYRLADLSKEEWFFTIISTQGDGEPPATAKTFYDHLHQNNLSLSKLKYGVLALGDTAYPLFCKAGEDVDLQFQKLGATRVVPLQKLDTDYQAEADEWFTSLLASLNNSQPAAAPTLPVVKKSSKQRYQGTILTTVNLNAKGSGKETYHIEIAADDVQFEPGDALGVIAVNDADIVRKIVALGSVDETTVIAYKN
jgi:sulfite reductase (NADPH) flavoprotein alpha-component